MSNSLSVFRPTTIGPLNLMNHFMRSATWDGYAEADGTPKDEMLEMLVYLAQGKVGLITTTAMTVNKKELCPGTFGMCKEEHVEPYLNLFESMQLRGNKVMVQINHQGLDLTNNGNPIAYVPTIIDEKNRNLRELTNSQIEDVIQEFINSVKLVEQTGADAVQIHCAHGFLLSSFLSPALNRRNDKWGGSMENRTRIVKEIIKESKKIVKRPMAFSIKFNGDDYLKGGITPESAPDIVNELVDYVDLFEVSCGASKKMFQIRSTFNRPALSKGVPKDKLQSILQQAKESFEGAEFYEEYNRKAAELIRKKVPKAKLALVGGNRDLYKMEKLIKENVVDLVSLSRPLLKNPFLVKEMEDGKTTKSDCMNCGACIVNQLDGIYCHINHERIW